jgi:ABC-2 type transport system ATP-binding protein
LALAVEVERLTKRYAPTGRGAKAGDGAVEALRGVDLSVREGELFALLGPNGAGKTTLLSVLTTLRAPTTGTARVLGHDVARERDAVRRRIGVVFQEPAVDMKLSCLDNLVLMGILYGHGFAAARQRAREVLRQLELEDTAARTPRELSGGQRRRLELGRALVPRPALLFLDEATLGLDVDARRAFWAGVRGLAASGHTVVFTTHYMDEADVADRITMIDRGQVVAEGTPAALKSQVGAGVLLLATDDDEASARWLRSRGKEPHVTDRGVYLEDPEPGALVPELLKSLPQRVLRVEVRETSLEDVFVRRTGRALREASR